MQQYLILFIFKNNNVKVTLLVPTFQIKELSDLNKDNCGITLEVINTAEGNTFVCLIIDVTKRCVLLIFSFRRLVKLLYE